MASEEQVECPQEKWETTCMHALMCAGNCRVHRVIGGQSMSGPSVGQVAPWTNQSWPCTKEPPALFPSKGCGQRGLLGVGQPQHK